MTSSIPSSFSSEDLQRMLDDKLAEREVETEDTSIQEKIEYIAQQALAEAAESAEGAAPVAHKVMALMICDRFVQWHSNVAQRLIEEGDLESAISWARDAGKFQAIMDILLSVTVGPDDFTFTAE